MEESQNCPDCGSLLVLGKPCAACLLGVGLESLSQEPGSRLQWNPPTVDELADRFPELEILKFIGRGGMGAVYQARQKSLNRLVALKILPPEIGHQSAFTERFAREAQAMARLNHPNIVTIYEFGERQGLFFFMMEFVDGVTLRQLLGGERISPREALAIVPQICDALQYAHDQGIVHRDIKPENILLDRQGRVKVADFGLAKLMAAAESEAPAQSPTTDAAATVAAVGTPSYMAPEQSEQPGKVDHRADIYALGVVFYQMLTGELPGQQQIVPPSQRVQIDVRLDQVVLRALQRQPELRYNQVSEVKTLLETIAQGQDASSVAPQSSRRWISWRWGVAGLLLLLAVLGGVWMLKLKRSEGSEEIVAKQLALYKRPPLSKFPVEKTNLAYPNQVMDAFLWCSLVGDVDGLAELFWVPNEASRQELKAWLRKTENRYRIECLQDIHWLRTGEAVFVYQSGNRVYSLKVVWENGRCYIVDDKLPISGSPCFPEGFLIPKDEETKRAFPPPWFDEVKVPLPEGIKPLPYLSSDFHLMDLVADASPIRTVLAKPWIFSWLTTFPDGHQCYCRFNGNEVLQVGILPKNMKVKDGENPLDYYNVANPLQYPGQCLLLPTSKPDQWVVCTNGPLPARVPKAANIDSPYKDFVLCGQLQIQNDCLLWGSNLDSKTLVFKRQPWTQASGNVRVVCDSERWLGWFDLPKPKQRVPVIYQFFRDGTAKTIALTKDGIYRRQFSCENQHGWLFFDSVQPYGSACRFTRNLDNGRALMQWIKDENVFSLAQSTDLWILPEDSDGGLFSFGIGGVSHRNEAWNTEQSILLAKNMYSFTPKKKQEDTPRTWELLFQKRNDMAVPEWGDMKISLRLNGKPLKLPSSDGQWYSPPAAGPLEKRQICQAERWGLAENQRQRFDAGFPIEGLLEGVKMPENLDPLRDRISYALSYMPPRQINPVPQDPPVGRCTTKCWENLPIPWQTPAETKAQAEKVKKWIDHPSTTVQDTFL